MQKTQMLKGILDWCVLSIIKRKKVYSQEIVAALREKGFVELSDGTLFPLMLRLEKDGYVDSEKKDNPLGASRKYYSLNETGNMALSAFTQGWGAFVETVNNIIFETENDYENRK